MRSLGRNLILNVIFLACMSIPGEGGKEEHGLNKTIPLIKRLASSPSVLILSDLSSLARASWGQQITLHPSVACAVESTASRARQVLTALGAHNGHQ